MRRPASAHSTRCALHRSKSSDDLDAERPACRGNRRWMGTTSRRCTVTVSSSPRRAARPPTISPPVSSDVYCWRWLWSPQRLEAQFCGPWATLAGGSLVAPSVPCTLLTPIAPHSLAARPFIVPESSRVVVTLPESAKHDARATLDGRTVRRFFPVLRPCRLDTKRPVLHSFRWCPSCQEARCAPSAPAPAPAPQRPVPHSCWVPRCGCD